MDGVETLARLTVTIIVACSENSAKAGLASWVNLHDDCDKMAPERFNFKNIFEYFDRTSQMLMSNVLVFDWLIFT